MSDISMCRIVSYTQRMTAEANCIFCKIIRGEIPSYKIYEDDATLAFLDIRPVNAGHTIVIPKKHSKNIFEVAPADWAAVMETTRVLANAIEKGVGADGINIAMNNREHAGQVVNHMHVHIIPRFKGDGFKLWSQRDYRKGEAESTQKGILSSLGQTF